MLKVKIAQDNFERAKLKAPFGFKGSYSDELWQTVVYFADHEGHAGLGLGCQSVLWSDAAVASDNSQTAGNCLMYMLTAFAARRAKEIPFNTPLDLLDQLLPETYSYGQKITNRKNLRLTFALNALVPVDNAAWQLYASANGITNFDSLLPAEFKPALNSRQTKLASIPLITYGVTIEEIKQAVEAGYFFFKIKIGNDPENDGDQEKMLTWDMQRLTEIHNLLKECETTETTNRQIPYYLDANGRYQTKERLQRLLDHAAKIGALERIVLLEEPFPEESDIDVSDLPVRLAADESAHSVEDSQHLIDLGYKAIALKPIAKTLSMSLRIAKLANACQIPCFCADLTVNPIMVDWNKNVAARLTPLPGMSIGVIETNGHQNYRNWEELQTYHPCYGAAWMNTAQGVFHLDDDFYQSGGGIFLPSEHYAALVKP